MTVALEWVKQETTSENSLRPLKNIIDSIVSLLNSKNKDTESHEKNNTPQDWWIELKIREISSAIIFTLHASVSKQDYNIIKEYTNLIEEIDKTWIYKNKVLKEIEKFVKYV
jgi:hypothetical protein